MELWNLQNVKLVKVGLSSSELRNEQDVGAWVVASRQSDSCLLGASPSQCRDDLFGYTRYVGLVLLHRMCE